MVKDFSFELKRFKKRLAVDSIGKCSDLSSFKSWDKMMFVYRKRNSIFVSWYKDLPNDLEIVTKTLVENYRGKFKVQCTQLNYNTLILESGKHLDFIVAGSNVRVSEC